MNRKRLVLLCLSLLALTLQPLFVYALPTHELTVEWVKEPECQVIINGTLYVANRWPQWLNFNVTTEDASSAIMELKMVLLTDAEGDAFFHFMECVSPEGWYAVPDEFDSNKNPTVIYFRSRDAQYYLNHETGAFGVRFRGGPESCRYNFAVYIIDANTGTTRRDLYACVDNVPPIVDEVWTEPIPDAEFPDNVFKHVTEVLICARAHDPTPHPSGVEKVELYLRIGTDKHGPWPMEWDNIKHAWCLWVEWEEHLWDSEQWYIPSAEASDAVCNTGEETDGERFFFCWESPTVEIWDLDRDSEGIQVHVDQDVAVNLITGFTPNAAFTISFDDTQVREGTTDNRGRAHATFTVPEAPRGIYTVRVADEYDDAMEKQVEVIPWVWPEENQYGPVGHTISEFVGKGFKENTLVDVVYRDVWNGTVYQGTTSDRNATHIVEWSPHLDDTILISIRTDSKGSFTVEIEIPESYGGLHPVFAVEQTPVVNPARSFNAMFFHVKTSIWVEPSTGLKEQFVTVYASGLPLPHYSLSMERWNGRHEDPQIYNERDWCLVLDFGPRTRWLWENNHIINGFFDSDWFEGEWWPVSYMCTSDSRSPVWGGQLCWRDNDGEYHLGSPFIKVPVLPPGDYTISMYQFGVDDGVTEDRAEDGIDHFEYTASTRFSVVTNPSATDNLDENPGTNSTSDLNSDHASNIEDIAQVCWAFNSRSGENRWIASADVNMDGIINILDAILVLNNFSIML